MNQMKMVCNLGNEKVKEKSRTRVFLKDLTQFIWRFLVFFELAEGMSYKFLSFEVLFI